MPKMPAISVGGRKTTRCPGKQLHRRILLDADQAERRVEQEVQIVGQEARMLAERNGVGAEAGEMMAQFLADLLRATAWRRRESSASGWC